MYTVLQQNNDVSLPNLLAINLLHLGKYEGSESHTARFIEISYTENLRVGEINVLLKNIRQEEAGKKERNLRNRGEHRNRGILCYKLYIDLKFQRTSGSSFIMFNFLV